MDSQQVSRLADLVMAEIEKDIASGVVPSGVGSFTDLHDHVDANEYLTCVPFGDHDGESEKYKQAYDQWIALGNAVAAEVDLRLKLAVSVQCYRCPCCGDDVTGTGPICGDCRKAQCVAFPDCCGDVGYWSCQRGDRRE